MYGNGKKKGKLSGCTSKKSRSKKMNSRKKASSKNMKRMQKRR